MQRCVGGRDGAKRSGVEVERLYSEGRRKGGLVWRGGSSEAVEWRVQGGS